MKSAKGRKWKNCECLGERQKENQMQQKMKRKKLGKKNYEELLGKKIKNYSG